MRSSIVKQHSTNSCHFSIPTNSSFAIELPAKYHQEFSLTVSSTAVNTSTTYCNIKELRTVPVEHIYVFRMIEELCYRPEGREFYSRLDHWDFSLAKLFRPHYSPGVDSASNRNEYQKYFVRGKGGRSVWLTYHFQESIVLKSGNLNLLEPSRPVQACTRIALTSTSFP
jgi:hypothetical protein